MALKHTRVAVTADDPTADVKMSDWNADHVVDGNGLLIVADDSVPAAPAAGFVNIFGRVIAGGALPAYISPSGVGSALQPFLGRNKVGMWMSPGNSNSTTGMHIGMTAPSSLGNQTVRNVATTNMFTSMRRLGYVSVTTAGARASGYGAAQFWRGNAEGMGGFRAIFRWGCSDAATVASARTFVGLSASANIGNTSVTDTLNVVGIGAESGDANLSIIHNDGAGIATKIDLGVNFPDHTLSVDVYELALFAPPNGTTIGYQVTRLNRPDIAPVTGTLTTDIPVAAALLVPIFVRSNGPTALAVGIDVISLYMETDN